MIIAITIGIDEITGKKTLTIFKKEGDPIVADEATILSLNKNIEEIVKISETAKTADEIEKDKLIGIINEKTTDEEKLAIIDIYEEWTIGKHFNLGDIRRHGDKLYKCTQSHTSQVDWAPDVAVSLWAEVGVTNPDTGLEELKPSTTNLYAAGDIGTWNGRVYESLYSNNGNPPLFEDGSPSGWWKDLGTIEEYLNGK